MRERVREIVKKKLLMKMNIFKAKSRGKERALSLFNRHVDLQNPPLR
jgi:hypothetical protein